MIPFTRWILKRPLIFRWFRDLKEYIKILVDTPKAFIFGFFDHNKVGNLIDKTIKVI